MTRRILVTWVGHTDLDAWSQDATLSAAHREIVKKIMKSKSPAEGIGPIKTLLDKEAFNLVHLIGDYDRSLLQHFSKWLKVSATIHRVDIKNPTDHSEIYQIVDPILESMKLQRGDDLCFHLSPGTPAMASIWVLLGKSKYPATLFQTHFDFDTKTNHIGKTEIPFDITVDVLPSFPARGRNGRPRFGCSHCGGNQSRSYENGSARNFSRGPALSPGNDHGQTAAT